MTPRPELFPASIGGPVGLMTAAWSAIGDCADRDAVARPVARTFYPILLIAGVFYARQARIYSNRADEEIRILLEGTPP